MPYALTVMLMAGAIGYLAVAMGLDARLFFVLQPAAVLLTLFIIGRRVPAFR
jgi:hypothetical protein